MLWEITAYSPAHTASLRRIYLEARQITFTWLNPASFDLLDFDSVIEGEKLLVALRQQTPVGFIAWWPPDNFIHSLFIDPAFTRQGVGRSLLQACLAQLGRPATLKCLQANEEALRFYEAQGWTITHTGASADGPYYLLSLAH